MENIFNEINSENKNDMEFHNNVNLDNIDNYLQHLIDIKTNKNVLHNKYLVVLKNISNNMYLEICEKLLSFIKKNDKLPHEMKNNVTIDIQNYIYDYVNNNLITVIAEYVRDNINNKILFNAKLNFFFENIIDQICSFNDNLKKNILQTKQMEVKLDKHIERMIKLFDKYVDNGENIDDITKNNILFKKKLYEIIKDKSKINDAVLYYTYKEIKGQNKNLTQNNDYICVMSIEFLDDITNNYIILNDKEMKDLISISEIAEIDVKTTLEISNNIITKDEINKINKIKKIDKMEKMEKTDKTNNTDNINKKKTNRVSLTGGVETTSKILQHLRCFMPLMIITILECNSKYSKFQTIYKILQLIFIKMDVKYKNNSNVFDIFPVNIKNSIDDLGNDISNTYEFKNIDYLYKDYYKNFTLINNANKIISLNIEDDYDDLTNKKNNFDHLKAYSKNQLKIHDIFLELQDGNEKEYNEKINNGNILFQNNYRVFYQIVSNFYGTCVLNSLTLFIMMSCFMKHNILHHNLSILKKIYNELTNDLDLFYIIMIDNILQRIAAFTNEMKIRNILNSNLTSEENKKILFNNFSYKFSFILQEMKNFFIFIKNEDISQLIMLYRSDSICDDINIKALSIYYNFYSPMTIMVSLTYLISNVFFKHFIVTLIHFSLSKLKCMNVEDQNVLKEIFIKEKINKKIVDLLNKSVTAKELYHMYNVMNKLTKNTNIKYSFDGEKNLCFYEVYNKSIDSFFKYNKLLIQNVVDSYDANIPVDNELRNITYSNDDMYDINYENILGNNYTKHPKLLKNMPKFWYSDISILTIQIFSIKIIFGMLNYINLENYASRFITNLQPNATGVNKSAVGGNYLSFFNDLVENLVFNEKHVYAAYKKIFVEEFKNDTEFMFKNLLYNKIKNNINAVLYPFLSCINKNVVTANNQISLAETSKHCVFLNKILKNTDKCIIYNCSRDHSFIVIKTPINKITDNNINYYITVNSMFINFIKYETLDRLHNSFSKKIFVSSFINNSSNIINYINIGGKIFLSDIISVSMLYLSSFDEVEILLSQILNDIHDYFLVIKNNNGDIVRIYVIVDNLSSFTNLNAFKINPNDIDGIVDKNINILHHHINVDTKNSYIYIADKNIFDSYYYYNFLHNNFYYYDLNNPVLNNKNTDYLNLKMFDDSGSLL